MNKFILILVGIIICDFSFSQNNVNEPLEPISFSRACLEHATKPPPDTLDCYPHASKKWLEFIDKYIQDVSTKLDQAQKKALEDDQKKWFSETDLEYTENNKIIQNNGLPIADRRKAAIKLFKIGQKRAEYLVSIYKDKH